MRPLTPTLERVGRDGEWQDERKRRVVQAECAVAFVPTRGAIVLGVIVEVFPKDTVDLARIMNGLGRVSGQLQGDENSQSPLEVAADRYVRKFQESGPAMLSAAKTVFVESSRELRGVSEKLGDGSLSRRAAMLRLKFLGLAGGGGAANRRPRRHRHDAVPASDVSVRGCAARRGPGHEAGAVGGGHDAHEIRQRGGLEPVASADELVEANSATVSACRELAAKTKRDQKCPITVAVPVQ